MAKITISEEQKPKPKFPHNMIVREGMGWWFVRSISPNGAVSEEIAIPK